MTRPSKQLLVAWDKKLRDSGFVDIEWSMRGTSPFIMEACGKVPDRFQQASLDGHIGLYDGMPGALEQLQFDSRRDKVCASAYAAGWSPMEIGRTLGVTTRRAKLVSGKLREMTVEILDPTKERDRDEENDTGPDTEG